MIHLLLLPAIAMFSVFMVCVAMLPRKLSVWLAKKGVWYATRRDLVKRKDHFHEETTRFPDVIPIISCEFCLTWWISLVYLYLHTGIFEAIILAGATAYLTSPLKKLI